MQSCQSFISAARAPAPRQRSRLVFAFWGGDRSTEGSYHHELLKAQSRPERRGNEMKWNEGGGKDTVWGALRVQNGAHYSVRPAATGTNPHNDMIQCDFHFLRMSLSLMFIHDKDSETRGERDKLQSCVHKLHILKFLFSNFTQQQWDLNQQQQQLGQLSFNYLCLDELTWRFRPVHWCKAELVVLHWFKSSCV